MARSLSSPSIASHLAQIRIVAVNDVYELKNLPRLQTFLRKLAPAPTAFVLAGDFLSPSTLSAIDGGRGVVVSIHGKTGVACLDNGYFKV